MPSKVNAPARAPFLQTPEDLIDAPGLTDAALRLLQALVKLALRNRRNSDAVAKSLRMGKDKLNAARKCLRAQGHWPARKRQNVVGEIRDQRMASLTPLNTADQIAEAWAAAEEAARLGKDTATSRRLGVRLVNAVAWVHLPATGSPGQRPTRRRPPEGAKTEKNQTPLPLPAPEIKPSPGHDLPLLDGALISYAQRAEHILIQLRRTEPRLALPVADARQLAHIAGHYLLRGEGAETIRAVLLQGLPADDIHSPTGFVRARLLRYLPPIPHWPAPERKPTPAPTHPEPAPPRPKVDLTKPTPPRTDGPAHIIQNGGSWRDAILAVQPAEDLAT